MILAVALVAIGGAGGVWALRAQLGLVKRAATVATPTSPKPVREAEPAPPTGTSVAPGPPSNPTGAPPALAVARPGDALANVAATHVAAAAVPSKLADGEKAVQPRPRPGLAGVRRTSLPPAMPILPTPAPAEPVAVPVPTPAPAAVPPPAPAPAAATVDVNALIKEAQQAWSRRYYGVAIDKAREVLKVASGRHDAYQIIAVCSCAVGAAEDAREAVSHLDSHKQKLVQSLCKNHGVTLE